MNIPLPGGKKVQAQYKGYTLITDQPVDKGGEGTAPNPFDLFLVSLGTCAGFYCLMFCQQRDIPTDNIDLSVETERDEETKMVTKMDISIHLPAGFPEKYKKAIVKAAEGCTVKKHLADPPEINIGLGG